VLSALSAGHKTAIVVVAAVFIVFALASSFVFPRLSPNFPGRRVGLFVGVCALLTAAMLGAVIAFAGEPKEERESEATTGAKPAQPAPAPAPAGNATAGKALFTAQGCVACHTFQPAGSTGTVGPDLDKVAADAQKANRGSVADYVTESIKDPAAYVVPGYPSGTMPSFASLSPKQIGDLVAFITSG